MERVRAGGGGQLAIRGRQRSQGATVAVFRPGPLAQTTHTAWRDCQAATSGCAPAFRKVFPS